MMIIMLILTTMFKINDKLIITILMLKLMIIDYDNHNVKINNNWL